MACDGKSESTWTPEMLQRLERMWLDGRSSREIADSVHKSRNAVIGKVTKLGLTRNPRPPAKPEVKAFWNGTNTRWTPDKVEELRRIWLDYSASEIGAMLGFTKKSVDHKARNLGLPNKNHVAVARRSAALKLASKGKQGRPVTAVKVVPPAPNMKPVELHERTGCCFPVNDGGPFLFCNSPGTVHGASIYCDFHKHIMVKS